MKNMNFIKICNDLDKLGFYKSSDKLEKLVKISQGLYGEMENNPVPLYSNLRTTNLPYTGNSLIDSFLTNVSDGSISDSAMGREFAGGRMYDPTAPYEGPGPDSPFVAPYQPSPTEQRDMDPDVLLELTQENAQQAANYISQIYEPFAQQEAILGIFGSRGGDQTIKNNVFENAMPMFGANVSRTLQSKPLEMWPAIIDNFVRKTRSTLPSDKAQKMEEVISKALSDVVRMSKMDPTFKEKLSKSQQTQALFRKYNVIT